MLTHLDALVSLVSHAQLFGDLVVVGGDHSQFLLDLGLAAGQVHVDDGQLVDAGRRLFVRLFDSALGAEGLYGTSKIICTYVSLLTPSIIIFIRIGDDILIILMDPCVHQFKDIVVAAILVDYRDLQWLAKHR